MVSRQTVNCIIGYSSRQKRQIIFHNFHFISYYLKYMTILEAYEFHYPKNIDLIHDLLLIILDFFVIHYSMFMYKINQITFQKYDIIFRVLNTINTKKK